jgi:hypothetical protein
MFLPRQRFGAQHFQQLEVHGCDSHLPCALRSAQHDPASGGHVQNLSLIEMSTETNAMRAAAGRLQSRCPTNGAICDEPAQMQSHRTNYRDDDVDDAAAY